MKANKFISREEHKFLLIVAFLTFVFAFASFTFSLIEIHNTFVAEEQKDLQRQANNVILGIYTFVRAPIAPFLTLAETLLSVFTFLSLLKARKFLSSSFFIILSFLIFIFWFVDTRNSIPSLEVPSSVKGCDKILSDANSLDFIVLSLVSILLFWQISILLRMLIKTLQRKTELP